MKKSKEKKKKAEKQPEAEVESVAEEDAPSAEYRLLRLQADFDNFRKRTQREKCELSQRANDNLMGEIIPVLDHFELALKAAEDHPVDDSFVDGVKLLFGQLKDALGKFGLESIDAVGSKFDPDMHHALAHVPSPDVEAEIVMDQTRKGYSSGGRLLRAADVIVSSGVPDDEQSDESESIQSDSEQVQDDD